MFIYERALRRTMWNLFTSPGDISAAKAIAKMEQGWKPFILDVRNHGEVNRSGVIRGTDIIQPHSSLRKVIKKIPRDSDVLVTCMSGMRSSMAIKVLKSAGFDPERLHNLKGGFMGWSRSGGPTERA